ncbi:hypothetical protein NDU88_005637 [Pleurodeles waltl]|uniref:Uncharacterized protein n=1 Tax=Pleurodeles waltl TaxID=8319 RepID=A0AAV7UKP8_PLEWA|nr:hypothetical protein NDU88_005637 [Pleurodeles waltl]
MTPGTKPMTIATMRITTSVIIASALAGTTAVTAKPTSLAVTAETRATTSIAKVSTMLENTQLGSLQCDGPDWVGPHCSPACAGASPADPEVLRRPTNRDVLRQLQHENGPLNGPASRCRAREANGREANQRKETEEKTNLEEEERATEDTRKGPWKITEQSAPLKDGSREKTRKSVVPIGDSQSRLRGAERHSPPCFRTSMAESGAWNREDGRFIIKARGFERHV